MKITKFWVVIKPAKGDTLEHICFESDVKKILNKYTQTGGIVGADVIAFYTTKAEAVKQAKKLLK